MSAMPSLPWRATKAGLAYRGRGRLARKYLAPLWRVLKAMADAPLAGLWTPEVLAARAEVTERQALAVLIELALRGLVEIDPHPVVKALDFAARDGDPARLRYAVDLLEHLEAHAPRAQASRLRWLRDQIRDGHCTAWTAAHALREASS